MVMAIGREGLLRYDNHSSVIAYGRHGKHQGVTTIHTNEMDLYFTQHPNCTNFIVKGNYVKFVYTQSLCSIR